MTIVFHVGYSQEPWGGTDATYSALGGTEKTTCFLAKELAKNHKVIVTGEVLNQEWEGVTFQKDVYKEGPIDVLVGVCYIHFLRYYEFCSVGMTVFWVHNLGYFPWYQGEELENHRQLLSKVDLTVCVSEWHMREMAKKFPELLSKITYVYNGIDTSAFKPVKEKEPNTCMYSSHPERGLAKVIEDLPKMEPPQKLYVATPQYGVEYLRKNFAHIFDMPNVEVCGAMPQDKLYELMARVENWYYPTEYDETFCITALEMMGHRVQPNTSLRAALAETVTEAFNENSDMVKQVEHVKSFDWSIIVKQWERIFSRLREPQPKSLIDRAYVICMEPSEAQKELFTKKLVEGGIDCPVTIIKGVDARTFDEFEFKPFKDWAIKSNNKWWNRPVTVGEIGCGLAHLKAWRQVVTDDAPLALVLEEDFYFTETLDEGAIPNLNTWDILYLGREKLAEDQKDMGEVVVPGYSYNAHAYLVTRHGAESLTQHNFQDYVFAPDEFLPATYCEHPREDLHWITRDTRALALKKDIAFQSSTKKTSQTLTTSNSELFEAGDWDAFLDRWIHPAARSKAWDMILVEPIDNVISFPLFTEEFCRLLIEEADANASWTSSRHEFYPTIDNLISSFGYDEIYRKVLKEFVFPAAIHRWSLHGPQWSKLDTENFMVKYTPTTQGHLDLHHDYSIITSVLTLNRDFEGGGTYFHNQKKTHVGEVGHVSIHPGQVTHYHGGAPVHSGERYILVSFCNKPT